MTPCVEWLGFRTAEGYGRLMRNTKTWYAHRWSWTQANGPIPTGMHVLHSCDNPPCVNVSHLRLGTQSDNNVDRTTRRRSSHRFSEPEAKFIRALVDSGGTIKGTARMFQTTPNTIKRVVRREGATYG